MLNKKDPLIDAIQQVMQSNQADRDAVKAVNEKFGIQDRRVLPRERQGEWDAAYKSVLSEGLHPNQQKLDVHEPEKDELTKHDFKMLRAKKKPMEEDVTSPSSMGIKKPDYATGTPDYAKSKEQMPNRAAKTSLPAGTMKEEEQIDEKAPPGAKYERMVKHIKDKMSKGGLTKKEKSIAYATSWKAKKKDVNEGFNDRHDSSVNASADKQVVADQLNEDDFTSLDREFERRGMQPPGGFAGGGAPRTSKAGTIAGGKVKASNINTRTGEPFKPGSQPGYDASGNRIYNKAFTDILSNVRPTKTTAAAAKPATITTTQKTTAAGNAAAAALTRNKSRISAVRRPAGAKPVQSTAKPQTKGTSVPQVAQGTGQGNRLAATRKPGEGPWGSSKPPEVKSRTTTPSGTFTANLQRSRQTAQNARVGGSTVSATQQASRTKMAQTAQNARVGGSTVSATQQASRVASRSKLAQNVKDLRAGAGKTINKVANNPKAAAAVGIGAVGIAATRMSSNQPDSTQAATTPTASKSAGGSTTATAPVKTAPVKPETQQPVQKKIVPQASAKPTLQSRNQRDDTIGASGKSTKGPGGVTSGTKTGTTMTNKPQAAVKVPVGTGRVK